MQQSLKNFIARNWFRVVVLVLLAVVAFVYIWDTMERRAYFEEENQRETISIPSIEIPNIEISSLPKSSTKKKDISEDLDTTPLDYSALEDKEPTVSRKELADILYQKAFGVAPVIICDDISLDAFPYSGEEFKQTSQKLADFLNQFSKTGISDLDLEILATQWTSLVWEKERPECKNFINQLLQTQIASIKQDELLDKQEKLFELLESK